MLPMSRSKRGQIIVVVALGLTILVAMVGVVIDGGMALSNRRQLQNAADAASLAGTRVLGLDLKWRATTSGNPSPPPAPFANADVAVCDAINEALGYDENRAQQIQPVDCYGPTTSADARYVRMSNTGQIQDFSPAANVGNGIPASAQGVRVQAHGLSQTMLMNVVGISTLNIGADATSVAGPAEPPIGLLMPFVVQNPLGPFVPGQQYQVRSESEGECSGSLPSDTGVGMGSLPLATIGNPLLDSIVRFATPGGPAVPVASPDSTTFLASITVTLSAENGAKIYYTTDGTTPTTSSTAYSSALTFTSTTVLKAIADKGNKQSDVGTFIYTQGTPPDAVTATPGDGTTFSSSVSVALSTATSGATIYYTTNGSDPTSASNQYSSPLTFSSSTLLKAIAIKSGISSSVSSFTYLKNGSVAPPTATPGDGTQFESSQTVTLQSTTSGATIYYTVDGSTPTTSSTQYTGPIALVSTTTIKAFARAGGENSLVVSFTYTKTGPVCPDLTAGNFGYVDWNGGSGGNNDLKNWIEHPETAPTDWYYRTCTSATATSCRDVHDPNDPADDHWRLVGTTGHRDVSLRTACDLYLDKEIYVPIWDSFELMPKDPNGHNAVFHLIGFAVFRLDGVIDNNNKGLVTKDACGAGIDLGGTPNDKGFVGTYIDSFVGTKVSPCIATATNPCSNLSNDAFTINLAE